MHIIQVAKSSSVPDIRILDATMINHNFITIVPSYLLCSCYAYFLACCCAFFSNRRPIGHQAMIAFLSLSLFLYFMYCFLFILFHYINSNSWLLHLLKKQKTLAAASFFEQARLTRTHSVLYTALAAASFFGTDRSILCVACC